MRYLAMSLFLTFSFAPDRPNPSPPPAMDFENIQGTWEVVAWQTENGNLDPQTLKNYAKLIFKGDQYTWSGSGGGGFKIDPTTKPKIVDYTVGNLQAQRYLGIYELNGDTLRDCMAPPGKPRPTEFTTPPGSGHILMVYKRVR